jgi:23S rRNA-/tRNA-specific pseudouridylate synthase
MHILYQDDRLIAVHKPSGLLVHRSLIDRFDNRRLLLAATGVRLSHPRHGESLEITAPLAVEFQRVIAALGWGFVDAMSEAAPGAG